MTAVGEGLRFELVHADPPPTPSGDRSGSHYSYRLVPADHGFAGWRLGAEFASWRSVDLGQLAGPKTLCQGRSKMHPSAPVENAPLELSLIHISEPTRPY